MLDRAYEDPKFFIDGQWVAQLHRDSLPIVDPATEETIGKLPVASQHDLDGALDAADRGFQIWKRTLAKDRGVILHRAAALLRERADRVANLLVREQGKPLSEAHWEVSFSADLLDWCADESLRSYGRVLTRRSENSQSFVLREPVGPVAAFSPWNVPVALSCGKIAPALAAGNSIIIKPAEETPSSVLEIARALDDAGLPAGVLNVVFGVPADISKYLIASPVIRKVSFTGSTPVGRQIATLAGQHLKRVSLELGGHAPVIIFDDADIELAAAMTAGFKFFNAGQVCFAPTRFMVQDSVHDQFVEAFSRHARALKVGNGFDGATTMGPLANPRRLAAMSELIEDAASCGAKIALGGHRLSDTGYFWQPTVLTEAPDGCRIMREEPFGPVAVTSRFATLDEAVLRANQLSYGLSAFAFTRSLNTATTITERLECGLVGINSCAVVSLDAPFGGVKDSGYGTEYGVEGLEAYTTQKSVYQCC